MTRLSGGGLEAKMAKIGYMRVSKNDQNTDLQRKSLVCTNCEQIFEDKISGKTDQRPGLKLGLNALKSGDTLVVWKLDRLGRSIKHLITLISKLEDEGIHFHSLTDAIDTSASAGRFFFHVMSALAQMERELIVERTKAGLAAARSRGVLAADLSRYLLHSNRKLKNYWRMVIAENSLHYCMGFH